MEPPPPADHQPADPAQADHQQPDDDAALALQLHREWNAPQKRVRHEERRKPAIGSRKRSSEDDSSTASSSSEDEEDGGNAVAGEAETRKETKKRKKVDRARRRREKKRAAGTQPWDKSRLGRDLQPHEQAAVAAVKKAARPFRARAAPPPYFKCFAKGVPWGVVLPRNVLDNPFTLADTVGPAFSRDGFVCDVNTMSVTMVTTSKETACFPAGKSGEVDRWTETAPRAARVYIECIDKDTGAGAAT